ncbi:MAG: secreted PhoX family phosphatase [Glaciecola sp.]|jgi:secreted PhoX family phosphatase
MSKETFDPTKYNASGNEPFSSVLEKTILRRTFLKGGAAMSALAMFSAFGLGACAVKKPATTNLRQAVKLGFDSIAGSKTDAVTVAKGYTTQVLAPWGTPLNNKAAAWKDDGTNTATDQANAVGMHHDGMKFFPLNNSSIDGLLCVNHEYIDTDALHFDGAERNAEFVRKEINAHGVSVIRIQLNGNDWEVVANDPHNRRFTGATEMAIAGPMAKNSLLITPFAPNGDKTRGTLNNCGNGYTPWGTYLTCEENWPGYFVADEASMTEDQRRIGISALDAGGRYNWHDQAGVAAEKAGEFSRFNVTPSGNSASQDYRNEANGQGYVVEIDPYDPGSVATKRTALGRFRHEGCVFGKLEEGKPIAFYSGHDARFEYIYRFVSDANWKAADADRSDRLEVGAKYMDKGTLYVARFSADSVGEWLALTPSTVTKNGSTLGAEIGSLSEIIINTAGAADLVGATPMDRPEWTAVDPISGTVYLTLTNNTRRTEANIANPRVDNPFGHIIRWDETGATSFNWDIFVFGSPANGDVQTNRSELTQLNQFASPDGLVFDDRGIMWIQTDNGADEIEAYTNDQMLAVIPANLVDANGEQQVLSSANQAQLKRFFVGPNDCEITGLTYTPDHTSFFANVQHPSNWPSSMNAATQTPKGTTVRPRAATVVIRKINGEDVGV